MLAILSVVPLVTTSVGVASAGSIHVSSHDIKVNQVGYQPLASKIAIVPAAATEFRVVRLSDGQEVLNGQPSKAKLWPHSNETVRTADFSSLTESGEFLIKASGAESAFASHPFNIDPAVLDGLHKAAIKAFYFNRSGREVDVELGGQHARAAGHADTQVKIHKSAATEARPEGTIVAAPKGWYDAGDYGKYVVNSGISTYTLMAAYQHFSAGYRELDLSIPESGDGVPDLIDEIKWNLGWLEAMQDADGGVYHKLTALQFSPLNTLPKNDAQQRWMIGKSVTATLDFAAVMAVASRLMAEFEDEFPGLSARYKDRALAAYAWAEANPKAWYRQPNDVVTGAYADNNTDDEFAWAAAELFLLTEDSKYFDAFVRLNVSASDNLSWPSVAALAYVSLAEYGKNLLDEQQYTSILNGLLSAADQHLALYHDSAYKVAMNKKDLVWGSNGDVLNNGMVLMQAYRHTGKKPYKSAAMSTLNYVLGANATGYSFVTGYGDRTPMHIHHRPSVADNRVEPVPGFLAGGPHSGRQDQCEYVGNAPATTYADTECSYSTNEVAINWNAPLVYMLGAAISLD